jgi:hypothetical protein
METRGIDTLDQSVILSEVQVADSASPHISVDVSGNLTETRVLKQASSMLCMQSSLYIYVSINNFGYPFDSDQVQIPLASIAVTSKTIDPTGQGVSETEMMLEPGGQFS